MQFMTLSSILSVKSLIGILKINESIDQPKGISIKCSKSYSKILLLETFIYNNMILGFNSKRYRPK